MSQTTDWEGGPDGGAPGGTGGGGPPSGPAGGDLSGTYPDPAVVAITESGSTRLAIGAVADNEGLIVTGGSLVGAKVVVSLLVPNLLANEIAFFSGTTGQRLRGGSEWRLETRNLQAFGTGIASIQGITYRDNAASVSARFAFKVGDDKVVVRNGVANGVIEIAPNTSTAGEIGLQVAARYEDDLIQWSTGGSVRIEVDGAGLVGIGASPVSEALLALTSTTAAFGLPLMTEAQRDAITPTNGFMVQNDTTDVPSFADGTDWFDLATATATATAQADATLALERRFSYSPSNLGGTSVNERQVSSVFDLVLSAQTVDGVPTDGTHTEPLRNQIVVEITTFTTGGTLRFTGTSFDPTDGSTTVSDTEDIVITGTEWLVTTKHWEGAVSVALSSVGGLDVVLDSYNFKPLEFGATATFNLDGIRTTWETTGATNSMRVQVRKIVFPGGPTTILDDTVASAPSGARPQIIRTTLATTIAPGEAILMSLHGQRCDTVVIHMDGALSA